MARSNASGLSCHGESGGAVARGNYTRHSGEANTGTLRDDDGDDVRAVIPLQRSGESSFA